MRTAGETPGLRLFGVEKDEPQTGLWERVKSLFTTPPGYDENVLDPEGGTYEDLAGAGSGWAGEEGGLEAEGFEDLGEVLVIAGVGCLVMGLLWMRARWAGWAEERRRRQGQGVREQEGEGVGRAGDNLPEPLIDAPIP